MNKHSLMIGLMVIMGFVVLLAPLGGYAAAGGPVAQSVSAPGPLGVVVWVWDSITFGLRMATFQVEGMPWWLGFVFLMMGLTVVWLLVNLIRGSD